VRVTYSEGGVPHVVASSAADLLFAQGYLTAADRLFQMDVARRTARGELAEIFGAQPVPWHELSVIFREKSIVDLDHFMRQLSLAPAARASIDNLSPMTVAMLDAYAAGVNAFIAEGPRPLECQLLGYQPKAWSAVDCALLWKALAFQLSHGWRAGLAAEALRARFENEPEKARALMPDQRHVTDVLLPTWKGAAEALVQLGGLTGPGGTGPTGLGGSNAWAVAPSRSKTGRAILCGDPHLPLRAPAAGYLIHLTGGGFDVAGWSAPGIPGVLMGHNNRVAWSITSGCTLDATWAMEQFSADGSEVRTATGFEPIERTSTDIFIRGEQKPVTRRLQHTANGPLFDAGLLGETPAGFGLALRWTGHLPTPDLDGILSMNRARDFAGFQEARAKVGSPQVNVVYSDVDGHIGWMLVGASPRFKKRPPMGAVPGWSAEHEWDGIEPSDAMPSVMDPPDGLIVSANQRLLPSNATPFLGEIFEPPFRARRIRQRLEALPKLSRDEAQSIQLDQESGFGLELRDRFVRPLAQRIEKSLRGTAADVLRLASVWDGSAAAESAGAAAFWAFITALSKELFEPELGERLYLAVFEQFNLPLLPLQRVLEQDGKPFVTRDQLDDIARRALEHAAAALTKTCGANPKRWQQGAFRQVTMRHPFSDVPALGALFTMGPAPIGGDGSTVNHSAFRLTGDGRVEVGPVFRQAVECGAWDDYRAIIAGGQGGDPTTGRYRELFSLWLEGKMLSIPFSAEAVAKASTGEATLSPAAGTQS
jgi:penicillin amidase